jgi:hypothetical protein
MGRGWDAEKMQAGCPVSEYLFFSIILIAWSKNENNMAHISWT